MHAPRQRFAAAATAVVVAAATLALAPPATAAPAADPGSVSIDLEGVWKFAKGDDPAYADPAFDDSAWADIVVPGDGTPFDDYDGYAWYRLDFTLPAGAEGANLV